MEQSSKQMKVNRQFYDLMGSEKRMQILQGGTRCNAPYNRIVTLAGVKPFTELKETDLVKTPNGYRKITGFHEFKNEKPCITFKMKGGDIFTLSEDHRVMYKGEWVEAKHLLSLFHERDMEINTKIQ